MNKEERLFNKFLEVARKTGKEKVVGMIETWVPFSDCIAIFGEDPTPEMLETFYDENIKE